MEFRSAAVLFILLLSILVLPAATSADSPQPKILLVEDAHYEWSNSDLEPYYTEALEDNRLSYDICRIEEGDDSGPGYDTARCTGGPEDRKLKDYDVVIWFTGYDYGGNYYPTLTESDRGSLAEYLNDTEYLNDKGKLFLTGQWIGYDIGTTDFYDNYLHSAFEENDYDECNDLDGDVEGVSGDPISDNLLINIYGGAENQGSPSIISSSDGYSSEVFDYTKKNKEVGWGCMIKEGSYYGALRSDTGGPSGYKNAYFGFGFEGIKGEDKRETVMNRVFDYLTGPEVFSENIYLDESEFGGDWSQGNLTCDPSDEFCHRDLPRATAYCYDGQTNSNLEEGEYFLDSWGQGNGTFIEADDGSYDSYWEKINDSIDVRDGELIDTIENTVSEHTLRIHCKDGDQYWGKFASMNITIDRYAPTSLEMNIKDYVSTQTPNITEINFDDVDEYQHFMRFSCDGTNWSQWTEYRQTYSQFNITNTSYGCSDSDGNQTVYMQVRDEAGNWDEEKITWTVLDKEEPSVVPNEPSSSPVNDNITVNASVTEETYSSVDEVRFRVENSSWESQYYDLEEDVGDSYNSTYDTTEIADGAYNVTFWANDSAGNVNETESVEIKVDNTPPEITIKNPSDSDTHSGDISLEAGVVDDHLNETWYSVRNETNLSEVFKQGTLNCQDSTCTDSWDSIQDVSNLTTAVFNLSANDTLSQRTENENVTFEVDNRIPSLDMVFPNEDYENSDFELDLRISSPGYPGVNISNAYYNITNSSSWFYKNTTVKEPDSIDAAGYNFTDSINISSWSDGKYSLYLWANNTENSSASSETWFYLDRKPPKTEKFQVSKDRVFINRDVSFSADITENVTEVKTALATLVEPDGSSENVTLTEGEENVWAFEITASQLGTYNVTDVYANDSLGNMNHSSVGEVFTVVEPSSYLSLNGTEELDAGQEEYLNFTYDFNKTVSDPGLSLYIPPNYPGKTDKEPYFENVTPYTCSFGDSCEVQAIESSEGGIVGFNITGSDKDNNLTLSSKVEATPLTQDREGNWTSTFEDFRGKNFSAVRVPDLNISNVLCDGDSSCQVNQSEPFNLSYVISNVNSTDHTGDAYGINVYFNNSYDSTENTTYYGELPSNNSTSSSDFEFNISEVGNYTFYLEAWEETGEYNTTTEKTVEVRDVQPPEVIEQFWPEDNIFNRNETVNYRIKANDNSKISQIWLTLTKENYEENASLHLYKRYDKYDLWNLTYENDTTGQYNITDIYVNDSSGNSAGVKGGEGSHFNVTKLDMNVSVGKSSVPVGSNQELQANVTGNASTVQEVEAVVYKPRGIEERLGLSPKGRKDDKFYFNGTYSNITRSGNYKVNITTELTSGLNTTESVEFSVPFGNSSLSSSDLKLTKGTVKNVTWFLSPENGDLIDLNGSVSIGNASLMSLAEGETDEKVIGDGNVTWEEYGDSSKKVIWRINVSDSTGEGNITLSLNSSLHDLGPDRNETVFIEVIPEDTDRPDIWSVSQEWGLTNLGETNTITVNASDNTTSVDKVLVEMDYPRSGAKNYTASLTESGNYTLDFSNTNETTNSTHRFNYTVYAFDLAGNSTVSEEKSFNVTDDYGSLSIDRKSNPYNKGENITFQVNTTDVHGQPVEGFNLSMNLSKNGTVEEVVDGKTTDRGSYRIQTSDPPESSDTSEETRTYSVTSLVTKSGNKGIKEEKFEVTEEIYTDLENPDDNDYFDTGEDVPVKVLVTDPHENLVRDAAVTAYCEKCPDKNYERIEWNSSMERYYDSKAFQAPQDKTSFSIHVYSVDYWKNKGYSNRVPTTEETTTNGDSTNGDGNGGGGGLPAAPGLDIVGPETELPPETNETWLQVKTEDEATCEYSAEEFESGEGEKFQESNGTFHKTPLEVQPGSSYHYYVKCQIDRQVVEESVAFSVTTEEIEGFRIEYRSPFTLVQGTSSTVPVTLINEGTEEVSVDFDWSADCCELESEKGSADVDAGESQTVDLDVHAPLYRETGDYMAELTFSTEEVTRERVLEIEVSEHLQKEKVRNIEAIIPDLEERIRNVEDSGLDASELRESIKRIENLQEEAKEAIEQDDLEKLERTVAEMEGEKESVEMNLRAMGLRIFLMENKWKIIGGILGFLLVSYLITQLLLPWHRIKKEVSELKEEKKNSEQSREKAEKQYFRREIDQQTFRSIMTEEQDKVLSLRSKIEEKQKELDRLTLQVLSPKRFLLFPYRSLKKLPRLLEGADIREEAATTEEGLVEIGQKEIAAVQRIKEGISSLFTSEKKHEVEVSEDITVEVEKKPEGEEVKPELEGKEEPEEREGIEKPDIDKEEKKFEEEVKPELEGKEEPEERISKLTELRRKKEEEMQKDKRE